MYIVINYFTDLQDNSHAYKVGDVFPRKGLSVSADRIKELSSRNNKQGKALIKTVEVEETPKAEAVENVVTATATYTKTDINRMSKDDLVKLATDNGIDTTDKSGSELKKTLIEYFKLD